MRVAGSTPGDGPTTASQLAYNPASLPNWTPDPSQVAEALDQLAARGDVYMFGDGNIASSTTTRYLTPGYDAGQALTTEIGIPFLRAGVIRGIVVYHEMGAGNGNDIEYTVRINKSTKVLAVAIASTSTTPVIDLGEVDVVAGDVASVMVTKALTIGASPQNIIGALAFR